jgi:HEAT repeat protein
VILLWLGREALAKEQKEALIKTLVDFEDGWESFYPDRAHFLAAVGIAEFRECNQSDVIVGVLVAFGFGYFNKEQQERVTLLYPIAETAREVLTETDNERAIAFLITQLETPINDYIRSLVAESLGKLVQVIKQQSKPYFD